MSIFSLFCKHALTGDHPAGDQGAIASAPGDAGLGRGSSWQGQLQLASSELHQVSASTEGEFLRIGERLLDFYQRAGEITAIVSGLVGQLGGERGGEAMAGLAGTVDSLKENLDRAAEREGQQALVNILERLEQVTGPLTGFGRMNKMLGMFAMYTKIESGRLGDRAAGFQSLAQDVTRLSGVVSQKADTVLQQKGELAEVIQDALVMVENLGAVTEAKIRSILDKTRESNNLLATIVERCSSSAGRISTVAREVTADLGEVVVSLQAHDTVRQQVEHVAETLEELVARLPEARRFSKRGLDSDKELLVEAGTLCQIQAEQLRHASAEIVGAVETIIVSLRDIAAKEIAMAADSRELLGVTEQAGSSFFDEMGRDLEAVVAMLTATASANRRLGDTMTTAAKTVGGIFRFVDDIETIAYDIKLISLNFLVQASALGNEGGGLGVLAEAIRRLSDEVSVQAEGVTVLLGQIKAITDGMLQGVTIESAGVASKDSEMGQRVRAILLSLQEMKNGMSQGLSLAHAKADALSGDIDELTAGITAHQQVAAVLTGSGTMLDGITSQAKALLPESDWSSITEKLRASDSRYTMHSERHIHATVINANSGMALAKTVSEGDLPAPAALTPPAGSDDRLGDNVELF